MVPYREQGEEAVEIAPKQEAPSIGVVRSVHRAPNLAFALSGPVVLSGILYALFALAQSVYSPSRSTCGVLSLEHIGVALAVGLFALLAWHPIRIRGQVIAVHGEGLVLTKGQTRKEIFFEDVNEVWLEIPRLRSTKGAYARAIVLLDFAGTRHRIPLAVSDGAILGNAILHACSLPLLVDARNALKNGETVYFGAIGVSAKGVTLDRIFTAWIDIRRVDLSSARATFYRKGSVFQWKAVRLDRIPNASIFCGLVGDYAERVERNQKLLVELASKGQHVGLDTNALRAKARRKLILAALALPVGCVLLFAGHAQWSLIGLLVGGAGLSVLLRAFLSPPRP